MTRYPDALASTVVDLIQKMSRLRASAAVAPVVLARQRSQPWGTRCGRWDDVTEEDTATRPQEIARAVLRYLEAHPEAKDTMEGIAGWWLERERSKRLLEEVERAVTLLLSSDLVLETRRHGMPPYYQINPQRREAITKMIEGS